MRVRTDQNRWIFGTEPYNDEVYFRQFGVLMDDSNVVTIDMVIKSESDMEIRINDEPINPTESVN